MVRSFENVSMISDCELFDTGRDILVSWVEGGGRLLSASTGGQNCVDG